MADGRAFTITRRASLLGVAVLAGVALTVLVLELALRRLPGPQYVEVRHAEFGWFTWFVGVVFLPTLVAVTTLAALARRRGGARAATAALVLLLLAVVVTALVNGPINVEQLAWNAQAPPADWASVRDLWQVTHAMRTVAIVAALGCIEAVEPGIVGGRP
jgi:anthrone oxygenase-like protein